MPRRRRLTATTFRSAERVRERALRAQPKAEREASVSDKDMEFMLIVVFLFGCSQTGRGRITHALGQIRRILVHGE